MSHPLQSSPVCRLVRLAALAAVLPALLARPVAGQAPAAPLEVVARAAAVLPAAEPDAAEWSQALAAKVPLMVQDVTEPKLLTPGVPEVEVHALHDGRSIAFLLEWTDATENRLLAATRFSDAAAIQLPVNPGPDVPAATMGQAGGPVELHLLKAAWQDAADGVEFTPKTLFPNMYYDHYSDEVAPKAVAGEIATRLMPARAAGNPNLTHHTTGTVPVQDLLAEGFGSATVVNPSRSTGKARYRDGRWHLAISRPLTSATGGTPAMAPGHRTYVAFAVWDGALSQAGARKMRSGWVPLALEVRP